MPRKGQAPKKRHMQSQIYLNITHFDTIIDAKAHWIQDCYCVAKIKMINNHWNKAENK